jgi:hypothetical protein
MVISLTVHQHHGLDEMLFCDTLVVYVFCHGKDYSALGRKIRGEEAPAHGDNKEKSTRRVK